MHPSIVSDENSAVLIRISCDLKLTLKVIVILEPIHFAFSAPVFKRTLWIVMALLGFSSVTGLLFQFAIRQICTTHLGLTLAIGIFFWLLAGPYVFKAAQQSNNLMRVKIVALGALLILINQIFVLLLIEFLMAKIYGCKDLLNTWLFNGITNNVLINAICFVGFVVAGHSEKAKALTSQAKALPDSSKEALHHIPVKYGRTVLMVRVEDIIRIEAEHNCITLFCENTKHVLYQSLKSIEKDLPSDFVRVHRSQIVNKKFVVKVENLATGDAILTLKNLTTVRMSRTYKKSW